jgi:beta-galactosidase
MLKFKKMKNLPKGLPLIGAEVFIEPGQTALEIDTWFKRLKECGMKLTRIRLFESDMRGAQGGWDFSLFDEAFRAGEKYGIQIYGNLFPATDFTDVGGFKFPKTKGHLEEIAVYIKEVVLHFKTFKSLAGWVPINEPGSGNLPQEEFSLERFEQWKKQLGQDSYQSWGFRTLDFSPEKFLLYYNTWFLKWLTGQIRLYDPMAPIHVNNHAIFQHAAEYDFPAWRTFLDSLGGSAHASWHFNYFSRTKYAVAMSANSEMLRSGAGPIPWLMTELQGGNNIYSAFNPLCPTANEITQWLWITIASGSKGTVFWCLNSRRSGFEAGEWAMLDYQNQPSDRMQAAAEAAELLEKHAGFFSEAMVAKCCVQVLYIRESLWIEKKLQVPGTFYPGRAEGGVMKSALAYFEALGEMGIHVGFGEISEFDFDKNDYSGQMLLLAQQISIPSRYWKALESFVEKGGKLFVDGLSAYYDENACTLMGRGFPFLKLFGGQVREFKMMESLFSLPVGKIDVPAHLWRGTILAGTGAVVLSRKGDDVFAVRNDYGKGQVLWIPSLLGLGARLEDNYSALQEILGQELAGLPLVFRFEQPVKDVLMKVLKKGADYVTVLVNKSGMVQQVRIRCDLKLEPVLLFADGHGGPDQGVEMVINPEETLLLKWSARG